MADEAEQRLVDLVGVGPDDRVRPARDDGAAGVLQQRGEPAAGGRVRQDTMLVSVDDLAGHFTGAHGEFGQHHSAQVEAAEQDMEIGG
jgi:hypothetical protein